MNKQKGVASMVIMIAMLVMAVALPIATKLVQQSQENRSSAASSYSGTCPSSCSANGTCSGSPFSNNHNNARSEADCLCATSAVDGCSNKYYVNKSGSAVGCMQVTSYHASASLCSGVAGTTCYENYTACKNGSVTTRYTRGACDADGYYTCKSSDDGAYTTLDSCETKCTTTTCSFGAKQCSGNNLQTCNSSGVWVTTTCANGCENGACKSTTTTYTCSDKACSANYGCMRNGVYTSSTADCKNPVGTVSRTYDANCPRISDDVLVTLGSSGNNDACQTTSSNFWYYNINEAKCKETSSVYTTSSACQSEFLTSTKGKTTGQYCYSNESDCQTNYKNDSVIPVTYTCSAKACSANYGCMRNGVYTSSTADCKNPVGTVNRTYDANCPRISDAVLATLGSSGNNDACQTTTACTANDKQCSGNFLQKCNSSGTAWETDTDCGDLGCDAATKACKVVSSTCDDIPTTCSDKDFVVYKAKGDFNCSGGVDIIDFNLWKGWYNAGKENCGAITDFTNWKTAFNKSN